uniref:ADP-ribosylglycohydrolase family protein n=1 Tax=Steinernema glaseri TaxID=37863 RepID=A0A1I7ZN48_9BILA
MTSANGAVLRRALGCLYGQLIGDSLGARYEFETAEQVVALVAKDRAPDGFLPILGGGPFSMQPGQVTDDSEMALSLARSMVELRKFCPIDVATSYVAWIQSNPPDRGVATENALGIRSKFHKKVGPRFRVELSEEEKETVWKTVQQNVRERNAASGSNGPLMRISPLGIASARWTDERRVKECVVADVELTHCHELVKEAVVAYVMAIRALINGATQEEAFEAALSSAQSPWTRNCLTSGRKAATPVDLFDGGKTHGDKEKIGFIGVALQSAFYELLHAESFSQGLERAILRGGDTDTNGCIVGALLGARFGAEGIPEPWKKAVRTAKPRAPAYEHLQTEDVEKLAHRLLEDVSFEM